MTAEQNPNPQAPDADGARPRRLTYAAALAGLEGLALVAGGVWMLVEGLAGDPDDRGSAVTGGVTLVVLALLPLLAARGLLARRSWSRGPAVITQIMALPVAYNLLQADSVAIPAGIAIAVVAIAALVLLVNAETTRALGIRGPGHAHTTDQQGTAETRQTARPAEQQAAKQQAERQAVKQRTAKQRTRK